MLVPISTATNTAGAVIDLPYVPNSIISDPAGLLLYLGSSSGIMEVTVSTGTVTTIAGVNGTIVAISPDGDYPVAVGPVANSIRYFDVANQVEVSGHLGDTTNSSAYTPDSNLPTSG